MHQLRCCLAVLCVTLFSGHVQAQITVDPPPEIIELSHLSGTPFTITGTNLPTDPLSYDIFVQVPGWGFFPVSVVSVTSTELSLVSIASPGGGGSGPFGSPANLQLTVAGVAFELMGALTFIGPFEIESVDPPVVSEAGGDTVTVTGVAFTPNTQVRVAGAVVPTTYVDVRTLTIITPPLSQGSHDVDVTNSGCGGGGGGGGFDLLPDALTVPTAMTLEAFEPTTASEFGGTPFILYGSGFTLDTVVEIAGTEVPVSLNPDANLTGIIPPRGSTPLGFPVSVSADDPQTGSGEILGAFSYVGIELTSVTPPVVILGTTPQIALGGTGFTPQTTVSIGDGTFIDSIQFVDSTQLLVNTFGCFSCQCHCLHWHSLSS
ncbi:MAG: IPT/TIG domain-containing protein [Planctomycetota bacterium]